MIAPSRTDVSDRLAAYAADARNAAARYLPSDGSRPYLQQPVTDYLDRLGKGIRPGLCIATCVAFGGTETAALPSAAAIELLHNAFLVHDDVEDESSMRRGAPTLHERYGAPIAINAGDALFVSGVAALRDNRTLGPRLADAVMAEFEFMARQTVDGQALELGWRRDNRLDADPFDYLELIMKKTSWYTTVLPLRVGALIGSHGAADLEPMIRFGFSLGAAFQIQDDILSLTGEPDVHGKEPLGDIYEGKRTLVLVHLLSVTGGAEQRWLAGFLGLQRADRTQDDALRVLDMMHAKGSIEFARQFAAGIAGRARQLFAVAFDGVPQSEERTFVEGMIPFMLDRTG